MSTSTYGPNTPAIEQFISALSLMAPSQWDAARTAWDNMSPAVWGAAWGAAREALGDDQRTIRDAARVCQLARDTARASTDEARNTLGSRQAAGNAALALFVRQLISPQYFETLTSPMRAAGLSMAALGREAA